MSASPVPGQTLELFQPIGPDPLAVAGLGRAEAPSVSSSYVLALADESHDGINAAWRAAVVAHALGMTLHLVHVDGGEHDVPSARARIVGLARQANERWGVPACGHVVNGDVRDLLAGLASPPALVVLPYKRGNAFAEFLFGTEAERIFRVVFSPTLVVKRPACTGYRRVLVPAKLEDDAVVLIAAAQRIARNPRIRVMHVLGTAQELTLRIADAPEHALRMQRRRRSSGAWLKLSRLIEQAGATERAAALVSFGDIPVRVLEAVRAKRAQVVVLGKRRDSLLGNWFTDGVSRRLIGEGNADVLLMPLPEPARAGEQPHAWP